MAKKVEFHPLANAFPLMDKKEFDALVMDIEDNGLAEDIINHDGRILDGRNRYNACLEAKVEPRFRDWDGEGKTPLGFVVMKNLHRRHLSETQRASVGAALALFKNGEIPEEGDDSANLPPSDEEGSTLTQEDAADLLNVSERSIRSAAKVLQDGSKELQEAMKADEIPVSKAAELAKLSKSEQNAELRRIREEREEKEREKAEREAERQAAKEAGEAPKQPTAAQRKETIRAECDRVIAAIESLHKRAEKLSEMCGADDKFVKGIFKGLDTASQNAFDLKRSKR